MKAKLILFAILLFAACRKDDTSGGNSSPSYARLEVLVNLCDRQVSPYCDPFNDSLEAVPGARVFLFEHEVFQEEGEPFVFEGTTNVQGQLSFTTLEKNEYWITVNLPQPDGRQKKDYTKTPLRTTTYLPVFFEKQ
jgi:hypothetical protein